MTKSRSEEPSERLITWPFVNVFFSNTFMRATSFMHITIAPLYVVSLGASDAMAGLTMSLFMAAAIVLRPLAGHLVDSKGRGPILLIGSLSFALAALMLSVTPPVWLFLITRFFQGAGFSLLSTSVMTMATDLIPPKKLSSGLGILGLEASLAQAGAPLLALWLAGTYGFEIAFLVAFIFSVMSLLLRLLDVQRVRRFDVLQRNQAPVAGKSQRAEKRQALGWVVEVRAWRPALMLFVVTIGTAAVNAFLALYALSQGNDGAGFFFVAMGVSVAISRLFLGYFDARWGYRPLVLTAIIFEVIAMVGIYVAPSEIFLACAGVFFGLAIGILQPVLTAVASSSVSPARRGKAVSTVFLAMDLSFGIGGLVLGWIGDQWSLGAIFIVAAVIIGLGLLVFMRLFRNK